jgi:hypothetical protein
MMGHYTIRACNPSYPGFGLKAFQAETESSRDTATHRWDVDTTREPWGSR